MSAPPQAPAREEPASLPQPETLSLTLPNPAEGPPAMPPVTPAEGPPAGDPPALPAEVPPEARPPRHAWVTLVMKDPYYAKAAVALAASIRKVGTRHELVAMITEDIGDVARNALAAIFDRVVVVDYIIHNSRRFSSVKQQYAYSDWHDVACTKLACLGLSDFGRIVFVDSDYFFVENSDELFDLPAPAARFFSHFVKKGPNLRPGELPGYGPYGPLQHGDVVPANAIMSALTSKSFIGGADIFRVDPSEGALGQYTAWLSRTGPDYGGKYGAYNTADEHSLNEFFAGALGMDFRHISIEYGSILWETKLPPGMSLKSLHYQGIKPWTLPKHQWPDLAPVWKCIDDACAEHPACAELYYPSAVKLVDSLRTDCGITAVLLTRLVSAPGYCAADAQYASGRHRSVVAELVALLRSKNQNSWSTTYRVIDLEDKAEYNRLMAPLIRQFTKFLGGEEAGRRCAYQAAVGINRAIQSDVIAEVGARGPVWEGSSLRFGRLTVHRVEARASLEQVLRECAHGKRPFHWA